MPETAIKVGDALKQIQQNLCERQHQTCKGHFKFINDRLDEGDERFDRLEKQIEESANKTIDEIKAIHKALFIDNGKKSFQTRVNALELKNGISKWVVMVTLSAVIVGIVSGVIKLIFTHFSG